MDIAIAIECAIFLAFRGDCARENERLAEYLDLVRFDATWSIGSVNHEMVIINYRSFKWNFGADKFDLHQQKLVRPENANYTWSHKSQIGTNFINSSIAIRSWSGKDLIARNPPKHFPNIVSGCGGASCAQNAERIINKFPPMLLNAARYVVAKKQKIGFRPELLLCGPR